MAKEFIKSGNLPPCRLGRNDLLELDHVLIDTRDEDTPCQANYDVDIETPEGTITASSLPDLLAHDDLPRTTTRLTAWIYRPQFNSTPTEGSIRLSLNFNHISLSIRGLDQVWVLGKYAQITTFFQRRKPWYWPAIVYGPPLTGLGLPIASLLVIVSLASGSLLRSAVAIALACSFAVFTYLQSGNRRPLDFVRVEFATKGNQSDRIQGSLLVLGVLAFVVSIAQLTVALLKK